MEKIKHLLFIVLCSICLTANADSALSGKRTITLLSAEQKTLDIGQIEFTPQGEKIHYRISMNDAVFSDEFLSMRPFKCIHQNEQMLCHLVYPYEKLGYITQQDMTDLEYDLLFLHKSASEYGINAWNGLYYRLQLDTSGLTGSLREVDLNILAAPPEQGDLRPITADMLYEADPAQHLFPYIRIQ